MQQPYQPQPYVYAEPAGSPTPPAPTPNWWQSHRRLVLVSAGAILGIVIIAFVIIFFLQRSKAGQVAQTVSHNTITQAVDSATAACASATDKQKCADTVRPQLATQTGDPAYCQTLSGTSYDACVTLAAITGKNQATCGLVKDATKRSACNDAVLASTPVSEQTYEACAAFTNTAQQQNCQNNWSLQKAIAGDCSQHVSDQLCADGKVIAQAIAAKNPDLCQPITDLNDQGICTELTLPGDRDGDGLNADDEAFIGTSDTNPDTDGDGLTDYQEVMVYHTNPLKADTDGDGYSDGVEVKSGHNPLGSGKL